MNHFESTFPIEELRRLVLLNEKTGDLFWKRRNVADFSCAKNPSRACRSWNTRFAGKEAFAYMSSSGYRHGALHDQKILAHRVVFALHEGRWPTNTIDHVNGDRKDNRPENLRDVLHVENCMNHPRQKKNTSGVTGVSYDKRRKKFEAYVMTGGKKRNLGRFESLEAAATARASANKEIGFHKNHGRNKT